MGPLRAEGEENAMEDERDETRSGRDGAAEHRRAETARRFVTVTRALASSGGVRARSGTQERERSPATASARRLSADRSASVPE